MGKFGLASFSATISTSNNSSLTITPFKDESDQKMHTVKRKLKGHKNYSSVVKVETSRKIQKPLAETPVVIVRKTMREKRMGNSVLSAVMTAGYAIKWLFVVLLCLKCSVIQVVEGTTSAYSGVVGGGGGGTSSLSSPQFSAATTSIQGNNNGGKIGATAILGIGAQNINSAATLPPNCSAVTHLFEARSINPADIIRQPINEVVLRYCELPATGTCCTYNMETRLAGSSRLQLERNTKESIGKLSSVLGTRAQKFNDFFRDLLAESKKEFHAMFKRTYGVIYEQNAYVFADLFAELENYYARGKVDLAETMDSFFNTLYQKMFTVLNSQYSFDDKYLGCVSEHMKGLKPFGDVPDKLSVQIKRSFVATRTYAQALNTASDIAKNMINIRPNADCTAALTKMQQCSACKGFTEKPCANYCVNVMKGCLQYYNELDSEWDNFVASMEKVSDRLLGPFNIVMVVEPINIKISEAIMNFQETGQDISTQVFQGCGRPVLGRRKRSVHPKFIEPKIFTDLISSDRSNVDSSAVLPLSLERETYILDTLEGVDDTLDIDATIDGEEILVDSISRIKRSADPPSSELQYEPVEFQNSQEHTGGGGSRGGGGRRKNQKKKQGQQGNKKNAAEDDEMINKEPVLDKLVKDIRQKVKDSKKFWSNLPYQICNNEEIAATAASDSHCWNGNAVDRYTYPIASEQASNPEFPPVSSTTRQSSVVQSQLFHLRTAINHLRNAYNGLDVEWSDQEEPYYGSGSGSGGGIDDEDDSGSGLGSFEDLHPQTPQHFDTTSGRANLPPTSTTNATGPKHLHPSVHNVPKGGSSSDSDSVNRKTTSGASAPSYTTMSLRRALVTYLFPIYMAWFGGIISDLL